MRQIAALVTAAILVLGIASDSNCYGQNSGGKNSDPNSADAGNHGGARFESVPNQQSNVLDALQADHPLSKRMDPTCPAYVKNPKNDPYYYTRRPADLTPVGAWAPITGFLVLVTLFLVVLRRFLRSSEQRRLRES